MSSKTYNESIKLGAEKPTPLTSPLPRPTPDSSLFLSNGSRWDVPAKEIRRWARKRFLRRNWRRKRRWERKIKKFWARRRPWQRPKQEKTATSCSTSRRWIFPWWMTASSARASRRPPISASWKPWSSAPSCESDFRWPCRHFLRYSFSRLLLLLLVFSFFVSDELYWFLFCFCLGFWIQISLSGAVSGGERRVS